MSIGDFFGKMWHYLGYEKESVAEEHIGKIRELSGLSDQEFKGHIKEVSHSIHTLFNEVESNRLQITNEEKAIFKQLEDRLTKNPVLKSALLKELGAIIRSYSPIENLPPELQAAIVSHMAKPDQVHMQAVSKTFGNNYQVKQAQKALAGSIARKAIEHTLEEGFGLRALFNGLKEELRNSVRVLDLKDIANLTAEDMKTIAELFPNTATLSLGNVAIKREIVEVLASCKNLCHLEVVNADLDDTAFSAFEALRLESLDLSGNIKITGEKFELLPLSLKELIFDRSPIKELHISKLKRLDKLERLMLSRNELQGDSFVDLPNTLIELSCTNALLKDEVFTKLSHLTKLVRLDISENMSIEGNNIESLAPSVTEVIAHKCAIPEALVERLKTEQKNLHLFP